MRQVRDGRGDDVAAPAVFDGHGHAHARAQVARLPGLGEAAELADLQVDDIHGEIGLRPKQHLEAVNVFVQHERMIRVPPNAQALLVGEARLLDVDINIPNALHHAHGLVLGPARVGVGDQAVAWLQHGGHGMDAGNVDVGVAADLELEAPIAFGPIACHAACHLVGRLLRDRAIKVEVVAVAAAEQLAHRQSRELPQNVPARDVDAALDVGVSLQRRVHHAIQLGEFAWVGADEVRTQFAKSRSYAIGIRGQVKRS